MAQLARGIVNPYGILEVIAVGESTGEQLGVFLEGLIEKSTKLDRIVDDAVVAVLVYGQTNRSIASGTR